MVSMMFLWLFLAWFCSLFSCFLEAFQTSNLIKPILTPSSTNIPTKTGCLCLLGVFVFSVCYSFRPSGDDSMLKASGRQMVGKTVQISQWSSDLKFFKKKACFCHKRL